MSTASVEPNSEQKKTPPFGEAEERKLASLFLLWREKAGLEAKEERQFALLLRDLVKSRAAEALESDAFLRLVAPFAGEAEFSDEEKRYLVRRVKPLLKTRELTKDEKDELAGLFKRFRMRLTSKLRRSISAALEAQFGPEDVLSEAYIRAETRWAVRPQEPEKQYVWLYGIVHEQFYDMLRKVHAVSRGGRFKEVRIPDNSAAEIALEIQQIQTGASTLAERKELVSRLRGFLERNLSSIDREIFAMRVLDRFEYPEIVAEVVRRAEESDHAADYQQILAVLDARSPEDDHSGKGNGKDLDKRRANAIRKRFTRAIGKLTDAIVAEFPELLDALPGLKSAKP
jgi:DNA-directed RNA polymerase specialized sigma24 family protein